MLTSNRTLIHIDTISEPRTEAYGCLTNLLQALPYMRIWRNEHLEPCSGTKERGGRLMNTPAAGDALAAKTPMGEPSEPNRQLRTPVA